MRLCRYRGPDGPQVAFYDETRLIPLRAAAAEFEQEEEDRVNLPVGDSLLDFLPPSGAGYLVARSLAAWLATHPDAASEAAIPTQEAELLVPVPRPNKLLLLAGNYADHIREGGGIAAERAETFPYVFMKPASTTLTHPGRAVKIPSVSPNAIDWELELAVVIGAKRKLVSEAEALSIVAGYTVINDISDRRFRPNADRKPRDRDSFFDWLHGKWHDSFCPCGPCVTAADALPDPQTLAMTLTVNGETKQNASTGQMIFPVAAVIAFISQFVTLEPGDIISTGTPAGVGSATGTFLKPGDVMHATIEGIGTLVTPMTTE